MKNNGKLGAGTLLLAGLLGFAAESSAISITGWSTVGNAGTLGANGVVTLSPFGDSQYGYVSTTGGVVGVGLPGVGGVGSPTNGSVATSPLFSANAGDALEFYFNFVTSDGAGYADYAWARLLDSASNEVALLFTARTTPGGNTVPGFGMPAPTATLTPSSTPIIPGGPAWSPLGGDSGACWDTGCGYTGWIQAAYTITAAGNYSLQFGTVNWDDQLFDTGMAFDGATIAGTPIGAVPEPATLALFGLGLAGLGYMRRRRA